MFKRKTNPGFSSFSDDEVISEAVSRLFAIYVKRGGDEFDLGLSFVIQPGYYEGLSIEIAHQQKFYRSQPALKLIKTNETQK